MDTPKYGHEPGQDPDACTSYNCPVAPIWHGVLSTTSGPHRLEVQYCEEHAQSVAKSLTNGLVLTLARIEAPHDGFVPPEKPQPKEYTRADMARAWAEGGAEAESREVYAPELNPYVEA